MSRKPHFAHQRLQDGGFVSRKPCSAHRRPQKEESVSENPFFAHGFSKLPQSQATQNIAAADNPRPAPDKPSPAARKTPTA